MKSKTGIAVSFSRHKLFQFTNHINFIMVALQYELTKKPSVAKFINKLNKKLNLRVNSQQYSMKRFYDSFDWRLYRADLLCELNQSKTESNFTLSNRKTGECLASLPIDDVPGFAQAFEEPVKSILLPILEMRALLSISTLPYHSYDIDVLNKNDKVVCHLSIEEHELLSNRIYLEPVKGCKKHAERVADVLEHEFKLAPAKDSLYKDALKLHGRQPKDYSSKTVIQLQADIRSDLAGQQIFKHLLAKMKANEAGTISNLDSEFLHDYRVSVRKTRAALNQLKCIFPSAVTAVFSEFFAWLGQITSETRDMDVYLLNFDHYKESLPAEIRDDLNPLFDHILQRQQIVQKQLAETLKSCDYVNSLLKWEQFLNRPVAKNPHEINARLPIKQLANQRIWKTYKKIVKDGNAITDQSAPEKLHDLRKTGKKLRYLLEFFQSLYPESDIKALIKALKGLQEILGDFQDYEVQEMTIKQFAEEMAKTQTPKKTFHAMDILVQDLDRRRVKARRQFEQHFNDFTQESNHALFKTLFSGK